MHLVDCGKDGGVYIEVISGRKTDNKVWQKTTSDGYFFLIRINRSVGIWKPHLL